MTQSLLSPEQSALFWYQEGGHRPRSLALQGPAARQGDKGVLLEEPSARSPILSHRPPELALESPSSEPRQ